MEFQRSIKMGEIHVQEWATEGRYDVKCRETGKREEGLESLPLESSPYVNYSDLEDYKSKGYGTRGHLKPAENGKGGGATGAPHPSSTTLTNSNQAMAFDSANSQRAP
ncbi:LEA_6 domain-containing protein [Cinnamomum micranthum f. kanehirae]|uniref:LEA_6 domain-containing protein n=1 Tax=Cinnamomum micranthum f. kanehirae TaxID=337451 RepID=A0A443Q3R7_9MAGN|nr:LEA_6 domain-containing protein [Cinnamomum micranthum f. kanehirae]